MQGILKTDSGILLDEKTFSENKLQSATKDYLERRNKALNAPRPNIRPVFSQILVSAVLPRIKQASGIIHNITEEEDLEEEILRYMDHKVSNIQKIFRVGNLAKENFVEGEIVKINFNRFRSIEDANDGVIRTVYNIPIHKIGDYNYMLIDQRDILWVLEDTELK